MLKVEVVDGETSPTCDKCETYHADVLIGPIGVCVHCLVQFRRDVKEAYKVVVAKHAALKPKRIKE